MEVDVLLKRNKKAAAAYIKAEFARNFKPDYLQRLLEVLLNPLENIDKFDTVEWCRWLMAGGCTPDEFASTGKLNFIPFPKVEIFLPSTLMFCFLN